MTEKEFINQIDCNFPYSDKEQWKSIILESINISSNASFMILHEVCRVPRSESVSTSTKKELISYLLDHFSHPILPILNPVIENYLNQIDTPVDETLKIMKEIALFPDQYIALSLPYMSCDDTDDLADDLYNQITKQWNNT